MPVLEADQRFERYRIVRHIGSSASGESYEAEDTILHRTVTLKLIQPWAMLPEAARRQFFREMQSISLLNHPYLATILDYGEIDGQLYVVRRYVKYGSLLSNEGRKWFRPPLASSDAFRYTYQLAHTLAYVHQHNSLHGSLTFTNVLVQQNAHGDAKMNRAPFLLADVGLAHFVRRFGQPKTPLLPITAAPEQFEQQAVPASDQFALAVLLYFWLTGQPPYLGSPEEIENLKRTETITPLTSLNAHVKTEQESLLRRALAARPEERYPSIQAFADALMETQPAPEPLPQPAPTPLPLPDPEPLPQPAPEPLPEPAHEPLPEPAPEPLPEPDPQPKPEPDIYQPLPQTEPEIPGPMTLPQTDPTTGPTAQEALEEQPALRELQYWQTPTVPHLLISQPDVGEPYAFLLGRDETRIGRAGSDDVLLPDTSTSRHHALLKHEDEHYVIYDQRSTNGVFVNGQKLADGIGYRLADGDHISIGSYELIFRQPGQTMRSEAHVQARIGISSSWK